MFILYISVVAKCYLTAGKFEGSLGLVICVWYVALVSTVASVLVCLSGPVINLQLVHGVLRLRLKIAG